MCPIRMTWHKIDSFTALSLTSSDFSQIGHKSLRLVNLAGILKGFRS